MGQGHYPSLGGYRLAPTPRRHDVNGEWDSTSPKIRTRKGVLRPKPNLAFWPGGSRYPRYPTRPYPSLHPCRERISIMPQPRRFRLLQVGLMALSIIALSSISALAGVVSFQCSAGFGQVHVRDSTGHEVYAQCTDGKGEKHSLQLKGALTMKFIVWESSSREGDPKRCTTRVYGNPSSVSSGCDVGSTSFHARVVTDNFDSPSWESN